MRGLTASTIVMVLACTAYGGLKISVNGIVDPPDLAISLLVGEEATVGIVGDGMTAPPVTLWLVVRGPGSISGGEVAYGGEGCSLYEDGCPPIVPPECPPAWLLDVMPDAADVSFISLCDFTWPAAPLEGVLVDKITLRCEGPGNVTLVLVSNDLGSICDTLIIRQREGPALGNTYHVDQAGGSDDSNGLSRETAFATIQNGIDTAWDGDTVVVWPGVYKESIDFKGRAITVRSAGDAAVIETQGQDAVTFSMGEGANSVLKNFVIRNSNTAVCLRNQSGPKVENLTLVNNNFGIAAYENSRPDISNCIFWHNLNADLFGCTARYSWTQEDAGGSIEGLVSRWKFDEGSGTTAYDSVGNTHATIYGAQWTGGRFNNALDFDGNSGVNSEGSSGAASPLNIHDSDLTVSAWVKIRGSGGTIVARAKPLYITYRLYVDTNKAAINTYRQGSGHWTLSADETLSPDTWYHIVGVFDRTRDTAQVYINGIKKADGPMTVDPVSNDATTKIGCLLLGQAESAFDGIIDDVMIFNRALSAQQVLQLYGDDLSRPVSRWKFDEGSGTTANDSVGQNTGTLSGAQWTAGYVGGALSFDGTNDYVEVPDDNSLDMKTEVTVGAWIRLTGSQVQYAVMVAKGGNGNYQGPYGLCLDQSGQYLAAYIGDGHDWNYHICTGCDPLTRNEWHHVAMTYSTIGRTIRLYINGAEVLSEAETASLMNTAIPLGIGGFKYRGTWGNFFRGEIDDVQLYDEALSGAEILQMYQGTLPQPGPAETPVFADPGNGDYHLRSERGRYWPERDVWVLDKETSPCIDGGDPACDYSAEPKPNGYRINMGAYGGTAFASRSPRQLIGDVNDDGVVNMLDFALVAENWLESAWPPEQQP